MKRIHYLLHVPFETPGYIEDLAQQYKCTSSASRLWERTEFPSLEAFDLLIVMGGPMNIYQYDKYPWLIDEKKFIGTAIDSNKTVLGICLGSQLIADVLGCTVIPNRCKEIGWYPIHLTAQTAVSPAFKNIPATFTPFHWHGDTYPVPPGAIRLGSSSACGNQGFIFDNKVVGLQFHLEMTEPNLQGIIDNCRNELVIDDYVMSAQAIMEDAKRYTTPSIAIMEQLFENILEL